MSTRTNRQPAKYIVDFETLTSKSKSYAVLGHTDVFLWYAKTLNGLIEARGKTLNEFYDWLNADEHSKQIKFHNLSFDGNFIVKYFMRRKELIFLNDINNIGLAEKNKQGKFNLKNNQWMLFKNNNRIYSIKLKRRSKRTDWSIEFTCSANLLSSSIEALGKDFGMKKQTWGNMTKEEFYAAGDFNMEPEIDKLMNEYIESDVEIARLAMKSFIEAVGDIPWSSYRFWDKKEKVFKIRSINIWKELTVGGVVVKLFNNYLRQNKDKGSKGKYNWNDIWDGQKIDYEYHSLANKFKVGGFTQFNPSYRALAKSKGSDYVAVKNGTGIDINSSYPAQSSKIMPYGNLSLTPYPESKQYVNMIYYVINVKSARIKLKSKDFVTLKNWDKDGFGGERYVSQARNFTCYYVKEEWDLLNESYDFEINEITTYYCKGTDYMKDFIEVLYKLKSDSKDNGKPAISQGYKTLLNALYGKKCARVEYENEFFVPTLQYEEMKNSGTREYRINGNTHRINTFQIREWENIEEDEYEDDESILDDFNSTGYKIIKTDNLDKVYEKVPNVLIGSTIAAYGRIQLQEAVRLIGWDKFIYGDTDSIYCKLSIEQLNKKLELHDLDLGAWSHDSDFTSIRVMGAKRYTMELTDHPVNKNKKIKFGYCGGKPNLEDMDVFNKYFEEGRIILNAVLRRKEDSHGILLEPGDLIPKYGSL